MRTNFGGLGFPSARIKYLRCDNSLRTCIRPRDTQRSKFITKYTAKFHPPSSQESCSLETQTSNNPNPGEEKPAETHEISAGSIDLPVEDVEFFCVHPVCPPRPTTPSARNRESYRFSCSETFTPRRGLARGVSGAASLIGSGTCISADSARSARFG